MLGALALAQSTANSRADFTRKLVAAAVERSQVHVRYVADYVRIPYPGGDFPRYRGSALTRLFGFTVKSELTFRKKFTKTSLAHYDEYPRKWRWRSTLGPDSNIHHRRAPNLIVFFRRNGESLPVTANATDYAPGDIVTWDLGHGLTHIGMVVDRQPTTISHLAT